jgi:hypothetical protein
MFDDVDDIVTQSVPMCHCSITMHPFSYRLSMVDLPILDGSYTIVMFQKLQISLQQLYPLILSLSYLICHDVMYVFLDSTARSLNEWKNTR